MRTKPTLFGRLSLENGTPPKLLLDGVPVAENQIVITKHGKGEPLPGRIKYRPKEGWYLSHEEFIRHTYLNIPLGEKWFDDLIVTELLEDD